MVDKFILGTTLRCMVTGITGIATARCQYLNGCIQYCITPKASQDGKYIDGAYIDQGQLEFIDAGVNKNITTSNTGGPQ